MFFILAILIGIIIGNHIKITVSPELMALAQSVWSWGKAEAIPAAKTASKRIRAAAVKQIKPAQEVG